ncbi:MAG TPA: ATP-binding protein [Candidatus Sumerlaeota bacterium]|nr:ATP-binding protein [Candidatus Sumerlaeota bacterium]
MDNPGFEDKLLSRLGKLDPDQVQSYVTRVLSQRQFLLKIFDHLDEGIIVTDRELTLLFMNRRARTMMGWPRNRSVLGEPIDERLDPAHPLHECLGSLRGRLRAIDGFECSYGRDRVLSLSTLPMRSAGSGEFGDEEPEELLIILLHDITERKEREFEQARAKRLASLATLTSGIAHEIKNPLNALNIHAQLLHAEVRSARAEGRSPDLDKTERAVDVMLEELHRMGRTIEEFLQAARPRSPQLESRDLRPVLESARRIYDPECEERGVQFDLRVDPDLPPVMIDEHLMLQVLRNLLSNALDAMKVRAEQARETNEHYVPRLSVEARLAGDAVKLTITDNGTGIPEEMIEKISEPFFTTKFGGSGLGLMVVYRIIAEHRGALDVETHPGEGTRFTISLPLHIRPVRLLESGKDQFQPPEIRIVDPSLVGDRSGHT